MHVLISRKNEEDPIKNETCKSMGFFFRYSKAANSAVHVWIRLKFEHIRHVMVVLVTCENEEEPLQNDDTRVFTTLIFQTLKGRKFELIQAFMHCIVSCKNEVDQINKEGA